MGEVLGHPCWPSRLPSQGHTFREIGPGFDACARMQHTSEGGGAMGHSPLDPSDARDR